MAGNGQLREELLRAIAEDERVRAELDAEGTLYVGYHPRMEEVHLRNAERLRGLISQHGWPGSSLVGEDGAEAAWRIVQHAISDPEFMRSMLLLVKVAVTAGEAAGWQRGYLEDRIRMLEGRPQLYGSQFDWNEQGEMAPLPMQDSERVNERRAALGLDTIEERTRKVREQAVGQRAPADLAARKKEMEAWARRVGWRK